jgi:zinc transport system substrate-binding protein
MLRKLFGVFILVIFIITMSACGNGVRESSEESSAAQSKEKTLKIFTTVYPLQYFTQVIAGESATVESILPVGSDPHTYEPTSKEIVDLAEADAFIYNGAGLEPYAKQISDSIKSEDVKIVEASKGIDLLNHSHDHSHQHNHTDEESNHEEEHTTHNHGDKDPHVWLDPIRSIGIAENIKNTLVEINPKLEETFNRNFEELKRNLEKLDEEFRMQLESLPGKEMIVSHAAYGYWEQSYGIKQIAVSGLSPSNEPSQKELENVVKIARDHDLKYVLFEQNITPKVVEVIRKEINAEALHIHNLSVLTEEDIANDADYFSLMRANLAVLNEALSVETNHASDSGHHHEHSHDEEAEQIYAGYFEDSQIEDRDLSDWEGDWQSVYPYLLDGTLDEVFAHKEESGDKTAEEYKEYYEVGYKTDVERIIFNGDTVTFFENGKEMTGTYAYHGYEILTYEAGNRGVRFIFELIEGAEGLPQYIQFSDHSIYPTKASHYHLYWGDDYDALLEEVTNWPTYYPSTMSGEEIAHEMIAH